MIERICNTCGCAFLVIPSRLSHGRGKHCSPACQYKARRRAPKAEVIFECSGCGTGFSRMPSHAKRKGGGKYCSRECRDRHWRGEVTPNWQGKREPSRYGTNWPAAKRAAKKRDACCQMCGTEGGLHVHHVIPVRLFFPPEDANSLDNLVTLCPPCHRRVEARFKWVGLDSGVLRMSAGGAAWDLARSKGMI